MPSRRRRAESQTPSRSAESRQSAARAAVGPPQHRIHPLAPPFWAELSRSGGNGQARIDWRPRAVTLCLAPLGTGVSLKECREGGLVHKAWISLSLCLLSFGTAAQAEWRRFETAHFVIYSESNDKQVTELAAGLESIDGLMRMATGLPADVEPVKVR